MGRSLLIRFDGGFFFVLFRFTEFFFGFIFFEVFKKRKEKNRRDRLRMVGNVNLLTLGQFEVIVIILLIVIQ